MRLQQLQGPGHILKILKINCYQDVIHMSLSEQISAVSP